MSLTLALLLAQADLGAALRFSAPADCTAGPVLASIVERMTRLEPETYRALPPGPIAVPGFRQRISPRFTRTERLDGGAEVREATIDLDLPGRWFGLRVVRLHRYFIEESDVSGFEIHFAEPPERVRVVLNRHGFRLPRIDDIRSLDPERSSSSMIAVQRIEGGAALVCATG